MNVGRTVFSQLIEHTPSKEFQKCVARYRGDSHLRGFSCWDQYLAMAFAQLTYRESLRDIEACLRAMGGKLYHMGFRGKVARSTLLDSFNTKSRKELSSAIPSGFLQAHSSIGKDLAYLFAIAYIGDKQCHKQF